MTEADAKPAAFPRVRFLLNNFRSDSLLKQWGRLGKKMYVKIVFVKQSYYGFESGKLQKFTALGFVFVCHSWFSFVAFLWSGWSNLWLKKANTKRTHRTETG